MTRQTIFSDEVSNPPFERLGGWISDIKSAGFEAEKPRFI